MKMKILRSFSASLLLMTAGLAPSPGPGASATAPREKVVVQGEMGRQIDGYLTRLEGYGFSGALIVAREGQIILEKGYGFADRERKLRVTPDTVFDIGSITKQFTATAILKLEAEGSLKVTDPIGKFFPGVPADKRAITLHHLLTHTAGLASDFGGDYDPVPRDEIVRRALTRPLAFPVGEGFHYSNAGYSLLAAIVELVSERSYEEFLRRNLFAPAGMLRTGYVLPPWKRDDIAQGYVDGEKRPATLDEPWASDGPWWNLRGNGGIHSTVGDMYRWHLALEGEEILDAEEKEKLLKPYVPEGDGSRVSYAYGWGIATTQRKTRLASHNGGNGIFEADFRRYLDENTVIFIASNAEVPGIAVGGRVARLLFGAEVTLPPKVAALRAKTLEKYAGAYRTPAGRSFEIRRRGDRLELFAVGQPALDALFCADDSAREVSDALNRRSGVVIEAAAKGDYAPIQKALGLPPEEVRRRADEFWSSSREKQGSFKNLEVLGTRPGGRESLETGVRLNFERGSSYLVCSWEGEKLEEARPSEHPPGVTLFPVSGTEFTSFSVEEDPAFRVSFQAAGSGAITGMDIGGTRCLVHARRTGA
jgi:CubicO group peptidase (beta-lactamase class C family)